MAEKSRKRLMLEEALADSPADPFLLYGLALQCLRDGATDEGRDRLRALIAHRPDAAEGVAAHQQLGQSFMDAGEADDARRAFAAGIALAQTRGDAHAAAEMQGMLQ